MAARKASADALNLPEIVHHVFTYLWDPAGKSRDGDSAINSICCVSRVWFMESIPYTWRRANVRHLLAVGDLERRQLYSDQVRSLTDEFGPHNPDTFPQFTHVEKLDVSYAPSVEWQPHKSMLDTLRELTLQTATISVNTLFAMHYRCRKLDKIRLEKVTVFVNPAPIRERFVISPAKISTMEFSEPLEAGAFYEALCSFLIEFRPKELAWQNTITSEWAKKLRLAAPAFIGIEKLHACLAVDAMFDLLPCFCNLIQLRIEVNDDHTAGLEVIGMLRQLHVLDIILTSADAEFHTGFLESLPKISSLRAISIEHQPCSSGGEMWIPVWPRERMLHYLASFSRLESWTVGSAIRDPDNDRLTITGVVGHWRCRTVGGEKVWRDISLGE